mgnify:CR=1 FL=1|jgi:sulfur-oxidizing protein SoxZ
MNAFKSIKIAVLVMALGTSGAVFAAEIGSMKIRSKVVDGVADVKVLIDHPMETGQRKDASGQTIPAHFIQTVSVSVNGKAAASVESGQAMSRNPVVGFKLPGIRAGDRLTVEWTDNKGMTKSETSVAQ